MKPDGLIVCEIEEEEIIEDVPSRVSCNTNKLKDKMHIQIDLTEEDDEIGPILPVEDFNKFELPSMRVSKFSGPLRLETDSTIVDLTDTSSEPEQETELDHKSQIEPDVKPNESDLAIFNIANRFARKTLTTRRGFFSEDSSSLQPDYFPYSDTEVSDVDTQPNTTVQEINSLTDSMVCEVDTLVDSMVHGKASTGDSVTCDKDPSKQKPAGIVICNSDGVIDNANFVICTSDGVVENADIVIYDSDDTINNTDAVNSNSVDMINNADMVILNSDSKEEIVIPKYDIEPPSGTLFSFNNFLSIKSENIENTDGCPCIIEELLKVPFADYTKRSPDDRKAIVFKGKPTRFPVHFTVIPHKEIDWLTGCTAREELYCWPCLLFQPNIVWSSAQCLLSEDYIIHDNARTHRRSVAMLNQVELHFRQMGKDKTSTAEPTIAMRSDLDVFPSKTKRSNSSIIPELVAGSFSDFDKEKRDAILLRRRPRLPPGLSSLLNERQMEAFQDDANHWLIGSDEFRSFFCWPCLLTSNKSDKWGKFGFRDFQQLDDGVKTHETSQAHMSACVQLKLWESELGMKSTDSTNRVGQMSKNDQKHRDFLKYVIDVVCFMKLKITNSTLTIDEYVDVLKLVSSCDGKLKEFINEKSVTSDEGIKTLLTPYLECISKCLQARILSRIKSELKKTFFVSLIFNDVSVKDKIRSTDVAVIVRYTSETGDSCERLVKFIVADTNSSILDFVEDVKSLVQNDLDCALKLVGFTYDGGVVPSSMMRLFNNVMKETFPRSNFFHYKEHKLPRVITQSLGHLECCKDFVNGLAKISRFFENSPKTKSSFITMSKNQVKQPFEWDFSSFLVVTIAENYSHIINFFDEIKWNESLFKRNRKVIAQADEFVEFLLCFSNCFLIFLLYEIFSEVDQLSKVLQGDFDSVSRINGGKDAVTKIKGIEFEDIFKKACSVSTTDSRIDIPDDEGTHRDIYSQVIQDLSTLLSERTADLKKWELYNVLPDDKNCMVYLKAIWKRLISSRLSLYITPQLKLIRLLPEFEQFCSNQRFRECQDIVELIKDLRGSDMFDTVNELYRFLMFIRTIPMIANDPKSVDPTLNKVKAYIKGKSDLCESDTLLWVEKNLLSQLRSEPNFQDSVIDDLMLQPIRIPK
ncbi:hypothetical protein GE061_019558 [Apolygus lucorum]|uniref:DUF4371 domain-containing protein n=1 Tax=Apolygus lucorum TaxID=248454 RepID=A0A8S9X8S4_APOLU|nr:hypothetical protein GE061_019558 [Apolygus lucorum]